MRDQEVMDHAGDRGGAHGDGGEQRAAHRGDEVLGEKVKAASAGVRETYEYMEKFMRK